jgi:hypothetical protein
VKLEKEAPLLLLLMLLLPLMLLSLDPAARKLKQLLDSHSTWKEEIPQWIRHCRCYFQK